MSSGTELPPADYEPRDASPGNILIVGIGLYLGLGLAFCVSAAFMHERYHGVTPAGTIGRQTSFHYSPEAKTSIDGDWIRQDAAVQRHLHTYGWIDRDHGVVRIPIDRAMDLLAAEAAKPDGQKGTAK
ncbi:MAG TPA: hypothetical protein VHE13_17010 [Opitutus sp.]|nr:hypothetical protein [Opitutus sp.]